MEVMECIRKRRSIRKYRQMPIPAQAIADMKEAMRIAPTGGNRQSFLFYFVQDEGKRKEISAKACPQEFIAGAQLIIAASCEKDRAFDVAIVMQNVVLAATAHGLGSCYIGRFEREPVREILNIPAEMDIPVLCVFGYPDEVPAEKERKPMEQIAKMV